MGTEDQILGSVGKGDDYFAARFDSKIKAWLALVEGRHANERVYNLFRSGDYNNTLADCDYTLTRFPNHPGGLNLVCEIAKATDRPSMPLTYFERALKYYPQYAFTHAQYGHYLLDIGATSAGTAELRDALRLDPNLIQARAWLAESQPQSQGERAAPRDSASVGSTRSGAARSKAARGK